MEGLIKPFPTFGEITKAVASKQSSKGGDRYIGRKLPSILKKSGFVNIEADCILVHSDLVGLGNFRPHVEPERIKSLIHNADVGEEQTQNWLKDAENFKNSQQQRMILCMLMAVGTKK